MNGAALALVLSAAVVHAAWNLAAKGVRGRAESFVFVYAVVSTVVAVPVGVVSSIIEHQTPRWTWVLAAALSGTFHVLYGTALQRGYLIGDLSIVYPIARGSGPLIVVIVAVLLLGEHPGRWGIIGAALVVLGVFVVGSAGRRGDHADHAARRLGVVWGLLTGAMIAAYTLWDDHAVTTLAVPPLAYFALGCVVQVAILAPIVGRGEPRTLWRSYRREVAIVGVLSPVAYILVLFAMRIAPVSLVAPAREVSIVFGGVAAWFVLREQHPVRRLAGSVVVLSGIAAIALASR